MLPPRCWPPFSCFLNPRGRGLSGRGQAPCVTHGASALTSTACSGAPLILVPSRGRCTSIFACTYIHSALDAAVNRKLVLGAYRPAGSSHHPSGQHFRLTSLALPSKQGDQMPQGLAAEALTGARVSLAWHGCLRAVGRDASEAHRRHAAASPPGASGTPRMGPRHSRVCRTHPHKDPLHRGHHRRASPAVQHSLLACFLALMGIRKACHPRPSELTATVGLVDPAYLIDPRIPAHNCTATPAFAPGFCSCSTWKHDGDQVAVGSVAGEECGVY